MITELKHSLGAECYTKKMELAKLNDYNFECLWQEDLSLDFEGRILHVINKYRSFRR